MQRQELFQGAAPAGACQSDTCQRAAEVAVRNVFAILGVDVDNPESVAEFQADLRFGKKMRRAADHSVLVLFGLVMTGLGAALWAGVVDLIRRGPQ